MRIYSAEQIRQWDQYTMTHEPIASIDLMERAARACLTWMEKKDLLPSYSSFTIFCGKGNNGGDGLALARGLLELGLSVSVYILEFGHIGTPDFQTNLVRLHPLNGPIHFIQTEEQFPEIDPTGLVIDALFGSGLNRPLEGLSAALVQHLNQSRRPIVSIDIPSGLSADHSSLHYPVIQARYTLCFQTLKPAFLVPENEAFIGEWDVLDIGLHPGFAATTTPLFEMTTLKMASALLKRRTQFAHKGHFGHAALLAGSVGSMGAAVLAARACMQAGAGKLTCYVPACGLDILQIAVPEAMVQVSGSGDFIEGYYPKQEHQALGIGPAIGTTPLQKEWLLPILEQHASIPMVWDADALTLLATYPALWKQIPPGTILTPHPGEWKRLFGTVANDFDRLALTREMAARYQVIIILKGRFSLIALPDGRAWINPTGNSGMATAGAGDVLTGILTGLLAQGYTPENAAVLGVYLHGLAGDLAADKHSKQALVAGLIIDALGEAYLQLESALS